MSEIENFSIDECNIFPIRGGYIKQGVFHGIYKSTGKEKETQSMVRVYFRKDKVYRIEDYLLLFPHKGLFQILIDEN